MGVYSSQAASADTHMQSNNATTNYGTDSYLSVGEHNAAATVRRSLVKFDISSIPSTAVIDSAVLSLWVWNDNSDNSRDVKLFRVLRNWVVSQATWNIYATASNWTTAGCGSDGNDADLTNVWATATRGTADVFGTQVDWTFSATGIAELTKFVNGTYTNYGWLIKADTENDDNYDYFSSEHVTPSQRPKLVINYHIDYTESLSGALTSSGAVKRKTGKTLAGALTSSGALVKRTNKVLAGALTSSGALSIAKTLYRSLAGALTSSGTLVKMTAKNLSGALTMSGALSTLKRIAKLLTAAASILSMTSPRRKQYTSTFSVTLAVETNWVDSAADQMVDNLGNELVFNDVTASNSTPIALTAPPADSALDVKE